MKESWKGQEGLERAKQKIRAYYEIEKKRPPLDAKGFGGIILACSRGEWRDFNIYSWNDLAIEICGKRKSWKGVEGLELAISEVLKYYNQYKKWPTASVKEFFNVIQACYKGYWAEFNIHSWPDLRKYIMETKMKKS